jgi:hypothetical protein
MRSRQLVWLKTQILRGALVVLANDIAIFLNPQHNLALMQPEFDISDERELARFGEVQRIPQNSSTGEPQPVALRQLTAQVISLALQLLSLRASESIGNHDSKIMDACGVG